MMSPEFTYASRELGRLVKGHRLAFEESRTVDFKEVPAGKKGPVAWMLDKVEDYVVAFLNEEGGASTSVSRILES